ncbi:MAG TPA: hypothetical protein VFZ77_24565 [Acidimicrobiales bacterium]
MADVFEILDREWRRLSCDRRVVRHLRPVCELAGDAHTAGDVERFVRGAHPADADRVLLALVSRAVDGDGLAARVLLQLLLPGTRALARRWWALGDPDERAAAAVTAVYHRIRNYPLAHRPGRIAANILMDAAHELRRAVPRLAAVPSAEPARQLAGARGSTEAHTPGDNPAIELSELLSDAVKAGIVERDDAELIARSRIAGHRVADIAHHRGLRPRTLWDRRQRAELALVAARAAC